MSWLTHSRHPKFQALKDKFEQIRKPYEKELRDIDRMKERLWTDSAPSRVVDKVGSIVEVIARAAFNSDLIKVFFLVGIPLAVLFDADGVLKVIAGLWLCAAVLIYVFRVVANRVKAIVLYRRRDEVAVLQGQATKVMDKLHGISHDYAEEREMLCENHVGRPPDWTERRAKVLARDGFKCTQCGYPEGFKRKSRELHVHHVVHVSDGGDNSMRNLVTLCHICHRNVGKHHGAVHKRRKESPSKRSFRIW